MRKIFIILTGLLMFTLIMVTGCDDDDCADCPVYTTPLAWTDGYVYMEQYVYFYTDIMIKERIHMAYMTI